MARIFKKTMSVIMSICMIISLMPVLTLQVAAAASGYWTESSNYDNTVATQAEQNFTITTAEQLAGFAVAVNNGKDYYDANNSRKYTITLGADIDLSDHYWVPIGTYDNMFSGIFNGNGHAISGMNVTGNYSVAGLFGSMSSGVVKNLTVSGSVTITDAPRLPDYAVYVGGLVGNAFHSTLTACTSNVNVSVSYTSANSVGAYVGGLAGSCVNWYKDNGVIASGCSATGSVNVTNADDAYCGGMFGQVESSGAMVLDCSATGNVTSSTGMDNPANYLGGFTGSLIAPSYNCFASGAVGLSSTVSGGTYNYIGGFAGWITPGLDLNGDGQNITDGAAYNCYALGAVTASGVANAVIGGFTGYIKKIYKNSNITNCWSAGSLISTSTGSVVAGGFFGSGYTGTSAKTDFITDCYWLSNGSYDTAAEGYATLGNVTVNSLTMLSADQLASSVAIDSTSCIYSTGSGTNCGGKKLVDALNWESEPITYASIWTDDVGCPKLNLATAWIYTYIDGVAADVSGYVELYQDGELMYTLARSSNLSTSEYSIPAVNGNYDIYINGADSGENIYFGSESGKNVYLYTVSFDVKNEGSASKSTISAKAGSKSISSGELVFKGSKVVISVQGVGARSYGYVWSGDGTSGETTKTLTFDSLSSAVNASCTVTGSNVAPLPTNVSIGGTVLYSTTASEITSASVNKDGSVYTLNCSTAFTGGAGTAIYDSSTGTLTLNDAAVPSTTDASGRGLYSDGGDLIVKLDGNNIFGSDKSNTIYDNYVKNGCLTVQDGAETGTGSLTIYSYNATEVESAYGLRSDGDLNFESGNYHFIGSGYYCCGMDAMYLEDTGTYGSININGGSIDIDINELSWAYGIIANNALNVNGGNIDVDVAGSAYGMYGKSVSIYGGTTINISAVATDSYAGGIAADGTVNMEGGNLTTDAVAKNGYGLYCDDIIISGGTLSATGSTQAISGKSITYNGTNTILSNTTPAIIAASTASGAVSDLSGIVFDSAGKKYTDSSANALTYIKIGTDTTKPTVSNLTPSGTGISNTGNIIVTFSKAMNTAAGAVSLDGGGTALTGGIWSNSNTIYTVAYSGLNYSTPYTVTVSGFKDTSDNTIVTDTAHSFTTLAEPDSIKPTVSCVTPSGTGISNTGNIIVTFSKAMNTTAGAVSLDGVGTALTGGIWSNSNTIYTVAYSGLNYSTPYTVTVSGFKDTSDNTMITDATHGFTTMAEPGTYKTLISITTPTAITGLTNGTAKTATELGLPSTVTLVTDNGNVQANVSWDVASCSYNTSSSNAQTFTVSGTVTLPGGVVNTNSVSLTTSVSVTVNAASSSSGGYSGGRSTNENSITVTTSAGMTTASQTVTAKTGSDGVATANVTKDQITDMMKAASKKAQEQNTQTALEIKVNSGSAATGVSVTIPQAAASSLTDGVTSMTISSPAVTVTFDEKALAEIGKNTNGDITVKAIKLDDTALSDEDKAVIGTRPIYDLKVTSGSTTVSSFGGGSATVSIPYTPAADENVNAIVVYYTNASGELVTVPKCVYDASTGMVTFKTTHFSSYAVGYNNVSFIDVSGWYADYVSYLSARGIINGTGNGKFSPDANITRAQFVTILANLSGNDLTGYTSSSFTDVATTGWYFKAVQWAYKNGIANGCDGAFSPNANITREQMVVMLYNYAKYAGTNANVEGMSVREFSDYDSISNWALTPIQWALSNSIISGNTDGSFAPAANATRAQAAKMISVFLQGMIRG